MAPRPGFLWTPGYWGFAEGVYVWHVGYWGPHVGFYGGINYGFGYGGVGFAGGEWRHGAFFYNRSVTNININIHNTYNRTVIVHNDSHLAFNGEGGVRAEPTRDEMRAEHEQHIDATHEQMEHRDSAFRDRDNRADNRDMRADNRAVREDNRAVRNDNRAVRNDNRAVRNDNRAVREDNRAVRNDNRAERNDNRQQRENKPAHNNNERNNHPQKGDRNPHGHR